MRDEAHRFSRKLHHKAEKKKLFTGWIDQIEGVGPKTKKAILEKLDITKDELKKMNATEISQYLGVNKDIADKILKVLS